MKPNYEGTYSDKSGTYHGVKLSATNKAGALEELKQYGTPQALYKNGVQVWAPAGVAIIN